MITKVNQLVYFMNNLETRTDCNNRSVIEIVIIK